MVAALDGDAVQFPTSIVAPDLVLDLLVAKKAADEVRIRSPSAR